MNPALLIVVALGATPAAVVDQPILGLARCRFESATGSAASLTRSGLRDRFLELMKTTARNHRPLADPTAVVPALVRLDEDLRRTRALSFAERRRKHLAIRGRLTDILPRLQRKQREQREFTRVRSRRRPTTPGKFLAGPADERAAGELISLIQDTIAPDSWDVRGGKGTIRYYPNFHVLVIRNTAEVHRQIGGTLKQLKK